MKKNKYINIGKKKVGDNYPCFVISEIGQAHDGSIGLAHSYIDIAKKNGADAVKFQIHHADEESTLDDQFRINFSYEDKTRYDYWKRMEFSDEQWFQLKKHCDDLKIEFMASVFSFKSFSILQKLRINNVKLASGEIENFPLLEKICKSKKTILLSTGMSSYSEIDEKIAYLKKMKVSHAIFQCTSKYPSSLEDVGLNNLELFKNRYEVPVGLSDHSGSIFPSIYSMSRECDFVELHLALDKNQFGPDSSSSIIPKELKLITDYRDACFTLRKNFVNKDKFLKNLKNRKLFFKSLALKKDMQKGQVITKKDLTLKKPGNGISFKKINQVNGKVLKKDVYKNKLLTLKDLIK